ncbi:hypothetical protein Q8A67_025510 [Cirrhinus molitorella]|uniref:Uncharacterized protein n=1 Tax=Cirrhinus molitorella TaxID=172907 RepID=A0AA88P8G5_9TELE|nr:hypothetical protein Q8A67_025510 [Cirrhinus molitorella]
MVLVVRHIFTYNFLSIDVPFGRLQRFPPQASLLWPTHLSYTAVIYDLCVLHMLSSHQRQSPMFAIATDHERQTVVFWMNTLFMWTNLSRHREKCSTST